MLFDVRQKNMGIEYNIKFQKPDDFSISEFLSHIENPKDSNGWSAFTAQEIDGGLYFCDNCWTDQSTIALRRIIDAALMKCDKVTVEEA